MLHKVRAPSNTLILLLYFLIFFRRSRIIKTDLLFRIRVKTNTLLKGIHCPWNFSLSKVPHFVFFSTHGARSQISLNIQTSCRCWIILLSSFVYRKHVLIPLLQTTCLHQKKPYYRIRYRDNTLSSQLKPILVVLCTRQNVPYR